MMGDPADVPNQSPTFLCQWIHTESQRCDAHGRTISSRPFALAARECPMGTGIEVTQRFQSAGPKACETPLPEPTQKGVGDPRWFGVTPFGNYLASCQCQLGVIGQMPSRAFQPPNSGGIRTLEGRAGSITNRAAHNATQ